MERGKKSAACGAGLAERWFASRGWTAWEFQRETWAAMARGQSGLVVVPTGAGKTYAAYLGALASVAREFEACGGEAPGLRIVYVTPLRAVARDIEAALREPVLELGQRVSIGSRTGDTGSAERARQRERPPNVLVTTPESLTLLLTHAEAPERMKDVRCVIVDEWHELLATKRGTQVELALARLRGFSAGVIAWGLSATLPNADEAARAIAGVGGEACVVRGEMARAVVVDSVMPSEASRLAWAGHLGLSMLRDVVCELDPRVATIVFTNTRSQAERWYHAILVLKPEWAGVMALHHGSIDRDERERVERGLKGGDLRIVVATSSLDLGVDFGSVERAFQIGSPKGVARLVQRAGRSGHRPRATCRVTCVPTHALELVEIAAAREALTRGAVEARGGVPKPLDVLVQHLVTCALGGGFEAEALYREVRTASAYENLTREEFGWCLALVERGGAALRAYPEFHRVEQVDGRYRVTKPRIAQLHRMNVGTITGEATVEIRFVNGRSLGRVEESFVGGLREGERFVYAGKVLRFVRFWDMVAYVRPASGTTTYTPIWGGTKLPVSEQLAESIRRTLADAAEGRLRGVEVDAARELLAVQGRESRVPAADEVLAEIITTGEGTHLLLYPFEGRMVHAGLASVLGLRLSRRHGATFSIAVNDYGLEILSAGAFPFRRELDAGLFSRRGLGEDAMLSANTSLLAKLQFREVARVAGLVFQSVPGAKKSARQVQASSSLLYDVLSEFDNENMLLGQARREVLDRHYEQGRLGRTMERLSSACGAGRLVIVEPRGPTPLSLPIMVERLAGRLSSETLAQRVERMRQRWSEQGNRRPGGDDGAWERVAEVTVKPRERRTVSRAWRPRMPRW